MKWTLLWFFVAVAGCSDAYPPDLPLDAAFTTCENDSDCVVVELGCCDECNGGLAVAVHRAWSAAVEERFSERCGSDVTCTTEDCGPWRVTCELGTCSLERDTSEL